MVTIVATSLFVAYMLLDPGAWLAKIMQLTNLSAGFEFFLLMLAMGGFACAWLAERRVFVWAAQLIGQIYGALLPHRRKKKKEYKLILAKAGA